MINFNRPLRVVYTKDFANHPLTHAEKIVLAVACLSGGVVGQAIPTSTLQRKWPKSLFSVVYHPNYLVDSESMGWVDRSQRGTVMLTDEGSAHLHSLVIESEPAPLDDSTELIVFSPKQAHDFDSFLRKILSSATHMVQIADSYVDTTIFDTLLGEIPSGIKIDLMINHGNDAAFQQRAQRFQIQYPQFHYARYPKLHDRYIIVDGIGFVVGPSLKDATVNAPALLVRVDSTESKKLTRLFDNIYSNLRKIV